VALSFIDALSGPSCVSKTAVTPVKVAVVLSDFGRLLVEIRYRTGPKTLPCGTPDQFSLSLWFRR
jgi:hypothetical protein